MKRELLGFVGNWFPIEGTKVDGVFALPPNEGKPVFVGGYEWRNGHCSPFIQLPVDEKYRHNGVTLLKKAKKCEDAKRKMWSKPLIRK